MPVPLCLVVIRFFDADFLLGLHGHRVGLWVIAIGAVPLDSELRHASVQGIALQRLQSVGVVEHFLRLVHQVLDGVLALRRLVGKYDGGLIEVRELRLQGVSTSMYHVCFERLGCKRV